MGHGLKFNEETIQRLFGFEAAEDEDFARLKEYYFKSKTYDRIIANSPIRILVGHKGIGKSALFKIAIAEDREQRGYLPILIKPDDLINFGKGSSDFLQLIRDWKSGLYQVIALKALDSLGINADNILDQIKKYSGKLLNFILDTIHQTQQKVGASLNPATKALVSNFIDSKTIMVYIDDLDRGWEGKKDDIKRISALLNAARDITNEHREIRLRIALRSDVYYLVRTSDESTDKIEGAVVWYTWTNHEILVLLIKRIETFYGRSINEEHLLKQKQQQLGIYLDPLMEDHFKGKGHWQNAPMYRVLMSLIRKRPRDLIKLCTLSARRAYENGFQIIRTMDFEEIFEEYSQGRIQDTINEYRTELPELQRLVMGMKPSVKDKQAGIWFVYTNDQLQKKLQNVIQQGSYRFADGTNASPKQLAHFLYKINFLTARKVLPDGEILRKYFEENRYLSGEVVEFGFDWEVHPAYRWALQPDTINKIFEDLKLSADYQ